MTGANRGLSDCRPESRRLFAMGLNICAKQALPLMGLCALLGSVFDFGRTLAESGCVDVQRRCLDEVTPFARGVDVRCPQFFVFRALHTVI